jgi:hypothetical protein
LIASTTSTTTFTLAFATVWIDIAVFGTNIRKILIVDRFTRFGCGVSNISRDTWRA